MSTIIAVISILGMMYCLPGSVIATPVLDQENIVAIENSQTSESTQQTLGTFNQFAQTFTVGIAGYLVRVDLEVYHETYTNGDATVNLVTTNGTGYPDSSLLASWYITRAGSSNIVGSFVSHDLGADAFAVAPGQIYAIVFTWDPPAHQTFSGFDWVYSVSGTYVGGSAFFSNFGANPTAWTANTYDYGFRSFVDVPITGAPEPATMLLLGLGLIGLAGVRKRMHK